MQASQRILAVFIFLISASSSFCQTNNSKPEITGQIPDPLTTTENPPITIQLTHLTVKDDDDLPVYPAGFTLKVSSGKNYKVDGTTVTPRKDFKGSLSVPVTVNDGKYESKAFDLKIEVLTSANIAPIITGQEILTIKVGENFTIELNHLKVTDPDNAYPQDFSLKVFDGADYTRNGNTIKPSGNFSGNLKVRVSVNDGLNESNTFDLQIEVAKAQNVGPEITGQVELKIKEDEDITLKLSDLKVRDPDNNFPKDFTLKILAGSNYTVEGFKITPAQNFSGILSVSVIVNDGQNDSAPFDVQITVSPINDVPIIIGQTALQTNKNTAIVIELNHLDVNDPDNKYPDDFKLKISNGPNYSAAGNIVNPSPSFTGTLNVGVNVNDGAGSSPDYTLKIEVVSTVTNIAPVITNQKQISITQNHSLPLQLSHLIVNDPDNKYPEDFKLKVFPGDNYSVEGSTITPHPNFANGVLSVMVKVNDGTVDSAPFNLKIQVDPISTTPRINGQKELAVPEDSVLVVTLSDLQVSDADDPDYPKGFSLILSESNESYTIEGNKIRPALNLNGFLEVGIKVSDGVKTSDEFKLSILVTPVNDPPQIINLEKTSLTCKPGSDPVTLSEEIDLIDVDNEYLSMAEIGFRPINFSPVNDELLFNNDSSEIKAIYDPTGVLFLIGYASLDDYKTVLRSIQYNYRLTLDDSGNPAEILAGERTVYINVSDGQQVSETYERQITMETEISMDIPNSFTPNGDSANDTWRVKPTNKDQLEEAVIRVYNKRGALLYEATGFGNEWDGVSNGQLLPVDSYYYIIDLNLPYIKKTYKGIVTILH